MSASTYQPPALFTSWKEIAAYLGKGVRTVQRWEQQFGLPVRRPNAREKGIVHANRQELDRWLELQWSQRPREFLRSYDPHGGSGLVGCADVQRSAELREANRKLLADLKQSIETLQLQCQNMTRKVGSAPGR